MTTVFAYDAIEQEHHRDGHPENRERLAGTLRLLHADGILDRLTAVEVTPVTSERLARVHPASYLAHVDERARAGDGNLDPDTYIGMSSHDAALASAGAAVAVTEAILAGGARRGMSLMRPPGHHALRDRAMGFCIFANVAVAAEVARAEHGLERVLIIDWDVHHGNGTEAIFYDDPGVAFFSTHQFPFYPGTGDLDSIGTGDGEGFTLNVPLPQGIGDAGYRRIFDELLAPFARRFAPELIIVSAGYDAHWRDPLANECLGIGGFRDLQRCVTGLADELCDGRLVLALEGGYDLEVLPHAILSSLRLLENVDAEISDPFGAAPHSADVPEDLIAAVASRHQLGR